jgi:hypothetical protein
MNLLEIGTVIGGKGAQSAKSASALKSYDNLAGAESIRRAGKAGGAPLRGDQASTLLTTRRAKEAQDRLGRQLTDYYQAMLREPVPDRIMTLVAELEAQQG